MKPKYKWLILGCCFVCAVIGFMIKIPRPLRGNDKLLHTAFYFLAAGFIQLLFPRKLPVILVALLLFGIAIEYFQELSNKLWRSRMHGRFDKEDIYANSMGLLYYLPIGMIIWIVNARAKKQRMGGGGV